jgi:hypothetical protein
VPNPAADLSAGIEDSPSLNAGGSAIPVSSPWLDWYSVDDIYTYFKLGKAAYEQGTV